MKRAAIILGVLFFSAAQVGVAHAGNLSVPRSRSGGSGATDHVIIAQHRSTDHTTARGQLSSDKSSAKSKVIVVRRGVSGGSAMIDVIRIAKDV